MCFSAQSSIVSFCVGLIGAAMCISLGSITDKIIGYFLGFVSLMQGVEYILWTHLVCDNYNKLWSIVGMVLNHLQPIVLGVLIMVLHPNNSQRNWVIALLLFYIAVIIPYSAQIQSPECTMVDEKNGHLMWKWNSMNYSVFVYCVFFITICGLCLVGFPIFKQGVYAMLTTAITYSTSLVFYPQAVAGALWCYYVAYLPVLYFFSRILWNRDN
jgi:hypothetical protein